MARLRLYYGALLLIAACASTTRPTLAPQSSSSIAQNTARERAVAPYYYLGWGDPPNAQAVMKATGVKWFTLAFILDGNLANASSSCDPRWDSKRALDDVRDVALVHAIRARGGDVMVSFGGEQGRTLELHCESAEALATAYEKVIAAYALTAIDIDLEGPSYADVQTQQRVVAALLMLRARHPELAIYITLASSTQGPNTAFIERAAHAGLVVDGWSIMTFDWGDTSEHQAALTQQATDKLKDSLMAAYGFSERDAYQHAGISSMNGRSDENGFVTLADMRAITAYAKQHQLARLTFWAVNRDRPCPEISQVIDHCSGLAQNDWQYTRTIAELLR